LVTVITAFALTVESARLVAVTTQVPVVFGAVNRPESLTEPPTALHETATLVDPDTVAVSCTVALGATVLVEGLMAIVTVPDPEVPPPPPPPHADRQKAKIRRSRDRRP
jgi:hypothetical protein